MPRPSSNAWPLRRPKRIAALTGLAAWLLGATALAAGYSLSFNGTGSGDVDRVKIRVDDPANALPGGPVDVGATDFTVEFWIRASAADNIAGAVVCGANNAWINGNIVVDRDRFNQDRKFGVSIAGGVVVFGVSGNGTGDRTICGTTPVVDNQWHHVAVQRRRSDGFLSLYVDGALQASADGPDGDISYPDNGVPGNFCGGPCTNSDPLLVLGAEKHDAGPAFPSYKGLFDELRISGVLRYAANFTRPRAPFITDAVTVALYHFDEGSGAIANDTSGAAGGPAHGDIRRSTPSGFPAWSTDTPFGVGAIGLDATIRRTAIATGFQSPVDIVAAPGDTTRLFIVEQGGRIRIIRDGIVVATPFLDVSSKTTGGGEQGLLGLAFHPNYATNRRLFVYYTRSGDGALIIERYERSADHPERTDFTSGRVLLAIPHSGATNHNGGKLAFRSDGYLYIGTGDGGGGNDPFNNGQNFGTRLGKMLRVDVNVETPPYYAIPPSNPYSAMTCNGAGSGTCPEIWALGLRNPFRFSFDRLTADVFIGDVGQGAREEVDYEPLGAPAGRNYGWRIMEGNICTPAFGPTCTPPPNYAPPIFDYDRGQGSSTTGGFRYRGSRIPALAGAYLYADFGSGRLWAATSNGTGTWTPQQLLLNAAGVSSFGEDSAGELYVTNYFNGTIYRLEPVDSDGDLLPDWWELAYFGSTTGANPNADTDGDLYSNVTEYLSGTDPLNAQSLPSVTPYIAPEISSANSLICVIGSPCSLTLVATGTPTSVVTRTGTLPGGVGYNASTRTISGTANAGTTGTYVQTINATNGILPNATQTLTIIVVAGCGGFTDVTGTDSYCNSVEWLRNRTITGGCTATLYCPPDVVTRASMALLQHRLGDAISPLLGITERTEPAAIDSQPIVCAGTSDLAPVAYPRNIQAFFSASVETTGALTAGITLVASRNAGATWEPVSLTRMRAQTTGATWRSASGHGVLAVNAGDAIRFGLMLEREGGTANVDSARCQIAWMGVNRDGIAPPRDTATLQP
jgi:glucose/arabinose dehydrogenase